MGDPSPLGGAMGGSPVGGNGYRQNRLEQDVTALAARLETGLASLQAKLDSIADRLTLQRESLPEHYVPRREINERFDNVAEDTGHLKRDLEKRIEEEVAALVERRREALAALEKRLAKIESDQTWTVRAVIGAILTGVAGIAFTLIRMGVTQP